MGKWGPMIKHDGAVPTPLIGIKGRVLVECHYSKESGMISPENSGEPIGTDWPGFYWRWKTRGFFRRRRIRVCDEPDYMPITSYRIWEEESQVEALRRLAQDTTAPITGPEFNPNRIKEKTPWVKPQPQKT